MKRFKTLKSYTLYTLLANVKILYKDSYLLRIFFLGLIMFNVIMRYGTHFIDIMNKFYDYTGL